MIIDLVFWSSFSAAVWITTPMEKHLLKLIPTIYDMHYVCWNWILQIPIQFNWMVMDMVVSQKFSSLLDYLVKYILHTSHIGKLKNLRGLVVVIGGYLRKNVLLLSGQKVGVSILEFKDQQYWLLTPNRRSQSKKVSFFSIPIRPFLFCQDYKNLTKKNRLSTAMSNNLPKMKEHSYWIFCCGPYKTVKSVCK